MDGSCPMAPMLAGEAGIPVHRTQGAAKLKEDLGKGSNADRL